MTAWLVGTLAATSALMALVLAVREPVRRWFGPHVAYALWILPAARAVLPPMTQTVERILTESSDPATLPSVVHAALGAPGMIEQLGGWTTILISLWLAGAIVFLVGGFAIYRAQRRAILMGSVQLATLDGIRIVRSEQVGGPLALGILDRLVVLPLDFDQRFSERQRCLALDHELAHHRSGDLVANLIAFVLLCLQWFNPLAWAAHAAFRFDQEAACDARVLDKADAGDRASYGAAIAKAASGRALLCAGALDRPCTLSRRLTIMTYIPNSNARKIGFLFIGASLAVGLPLTATRAVHYVDKVRPAAMASVIPAAPAMSAAAVVAAQAPAASSVPAQVADAVKENPDGTVTIARGVTIDKGSVAYMSDDRIIINGRIKRLEDLTPAERATLRTNIARSLKDVQRERAELPARLAEAKREIERIQSGEMERELQENLKDLRADLARVDSEAAELRRAGQDPEKVKAQIRQALHEAETEGMSDLREARSELSELNPDHLVAEVREAEEQMVRLTAKLNQLDGTQ